MRRILWHIVISHYSEKARWALDFKHVDAELRAPAPGLHMAVAAWLTRGRHVTFPILQLDGDTFADSTAIVAALEDRFRDPPLYPREPELHRRALELEDWFDEELGPYMRRVVFHELRSEAESFDALAALAAPAAARRLGTANLGRCARALTGVRYRAIDHQRAEAAGERVAAALDRLEAELGGDEYLVGGRFTVADLTASALFYPLVLPREGPIALEKRPQAHVRWRTTFESRPGWRWVEQMYSRHRHPT